MICQAQVWKVKTRIKGISLSNKGLRNLQRAGGGRGEEQQGWRLMRGLWWGRWEETPVAEAERKRYVLGGLQSLQPT